MKATLPLTPVLKWAGGKRQLLSTMTPLLPPEIKSYCEPFVGGGALLFALKPKKALVNDLNSELINLYEIIRDHVDELLDTVQKHVNDHEYFYSLRNIDQDPEAFAALSRIERAARILYLNHTCYNGLFRVNSKGHFNVPYGYYKNPNYFNPELLHAVSNYLQKAKIQFSSVDYEQVLSKVPKDCFVYLDPPYDPVSSSSSFTRYNKEGFDREEQIRLKEACDRLNKRNIKFMLSNSATDFIKDLYSEYNVHIVPANRTINANSKRRGKVDEVLVTNY